MSLFVNYHLTNSSTIVAPLVILLNLINVCVYVLASSIECCSTDLFRHCHHYPLSGDRNAVTSLSDTSATSRWNGFSFPFLTKHDVKSQPINACIPSSASVIPILFLVQNGSNIRHSDVSSVISGAVVEDAFTSPRSSGKPNKNHIRVGRSYQYAA